MTPSASPCCQEHAHSAQDPVEGIPPLQDGPKHAGGEYVCPMHPEIVREGPASCPVCGMALEPRVVQLDQEENLEFVDMRRRFLGSAVFTVPVFLLGMTEMIPGDPLASFLPHGWRNPLELALSAPAVLWGGWPFFRRAWASLVSELQHVHARRARERRGVPLQRPRDVRAGPLPPAFRDHHGEVESTSRPPRSSSRWSCSGRSSSCAPAAGRAARCGPCSASRRRPPGA